jgi:casein kinase I family protein HRR25
MLYFMLGSLPWQGLKTPTREQRYRLVLEKKQTTSVAELCGNLPQEFAIYMNYVRNLRHEDKPDYGYLRRIFRNLFRRQRFEYDHVFDWTIREYQRQNVECAEQSSATRNAEIMRGEERREQPEGPSRHVAKRRRRRRKRT